METSIISEGAEAAVGVEVMEAPKCMHEWLIDSPSGPSSRGVCLQCGAEKEFQNFIEGSAWGYDMSVELLSGGGRLPVASGASGKVGLAEDE